MDELDDVVNETLEGLANGKITLDEAKGLIKAIIDSVINN